MPNSGEFYVCIISFNKNLFSFRNKGNKETKEQAPSNKQWKLRKRRNINSQSVKVDEIFRKFTLKCPRNNLHSYGESDKI